MVFSKILTFLKDEGCDPSWPNPSNLTLQAAFLRTSNEARMRKSRDRFPRGLWEASDNSQAADP